jgi:hypothetical protein
MTPYDLQTLRRKSLKDLADIGSDFGLTFSKNHTKTLRATRILQAQTERAAAVVSSDPSPHNLADSATPTTAAPVFDRLTGGDPRGDPRGGPRPGAGRPPGMTNEKAAMNRLSEQPHPVVKGSLELLFNRWAASTKCKKVALTKDEAFGLALAWTQVGDYFGVTDRIPVWLQLGIVALWTTANIIASKAQIARNFRAQQAVENEPKSEKAAA